MTWQTLKTHLYEITHTHSPESHEPEKQTLASSNAQQTHWIGWDGWVNVPRKQSGTKR